MPDALPTVPDDQQRREVLAALGDDATGAVVALLLQGAQTQPEIAAATGLDRPAVSRALKLLRTLGLVASGRGLSAHHVLRERDGVLAIIDAADGLCGAVNAARDKAQRAAEKSAREARLRPAEEPPAENGAGGG